MIRLLIWLLFIYIGFRIVKALTAPKETRPGGTGTGEDAAVTHRDPVCGIYVAEDDAVVGTLDGQRHYFCSMNCLEKFREQLDHTSP